MEAHAPARGLPDMSVWLGTSTHGGTSSGGQSSSRATVDTFQGHGGEDEDEDEDEDKDEDEDEDEDEDKEEHGYEDLGPSQL